MKIETDAKTDNRAAPWFRTTSIVNMGYQILRFPASERSGACERNVGANQALSSADRANKYAMRVNKRADKQVPWIVVHRYTGPVSNVIPSILKTVFLFHE